MPTIKAQCRCWFIFPPLTLEESEPMPDLYCPVCRGAAQFAKVEVIEAACNDYLVVFYGSGRTVHQRTYYKCLDQDEALQRFVLEHGQDAVERVVNIIEFHPPALFNGGRDAFIRAEVEAMEWPEVIGE